MQKQIRQPATINSSLPNICLFRPNGGNIGDAMHYRGLTYILDSAFPREKRNTFEMFGEEIFSSSTLEFINNKFDYIVVCGAPWLWDNIYPDVGDSPGIVHRYHEFDKLLNLNTRAVKLAFAIGSSFPIGYTISTAKTFPVCAQFHDRNAHHIARIWKQFSYIVTRDLLSKDILAEYGIVSQQAPCTSLFTEMTYKPKTLKQNYPLLVFFAVHGGHSKHHLTEEFMNDYYKMQYGFIAKYNPKVVCITKFDYEYYPQGAAKFGIKNPPPIKCFKPEDDYNTVSDENELISMLYNASFVVTGRVHAGIPAKSFGTPVICLPTDTRALCVQDVGGVLAYNEKQLSLHLGDKDKQREVNIRVWRDKYKEFVKEAFKKVL